jgi:hypothetical protein
VGYGTAKPSSWNCRKMCEAEFEQQLELDRKEGKALLRKLVQKSDDIDWEAVIQQADILHKREQERIRRRSWRSRNKRTLLQKRRKYEQTGCFSVNLLVLSSSEEDVQAVDRWRQRSRSFAHNSSETTSSSSKDEADHHHPVLSNTASL